MEGQLALASREGSANAASAYVRAARGRVDDAYRLAGYLLGDAAEAQDAVQDALVRAWRSWPSLHDQAAFGPWFDRIVVNVCRDRMRRHRTLRMVALEAAESVESADSFAPRFVEEEVAAAVARLKPDQRVVVALRFWRDMTLEEIAVTLGLPVGTVKSRLHYALEGLRRGLGEMER